jgi:hypothetical protein
VNAKAYCLIRREPHYRHDAFVAGLRAVGYDVELGYSAWPIKPGDVLLIWNRYDATERIADKFEAAGGTVLVAENGYLGPGGVSPHAMQPRSIYAIARHAHNGRGQWHVGGPERWEALGVELKPWRTNGEHILICANRSFGMSGGVMPHDWAVNVAGRLKQITRRPIRIRNHPGNYASKVPLAQDLENAHACVIWSSSCGVHALVAGVPVICEAPWWICKTGAWVESVIGDASQHAYSPASSYAYHASKLRLATLHRLAWAQWTVEEIASGEPFRYLLSDTRQTESAAAV